METIPSSNPPGAARPTHPWIWALAALVFVLVLVAHFSELERLLRVAREGIWYLVLLAILLEGAFVVNQAALYALISQLTHCPLRTRDLLMPVLAADFLEVATPTPIGNVPGVALIVRQAERRGMSRTEAVLVNVIYFVLDYAAFLTVLGTGLLYLSLFHDLKPYEWAAALCLAVVVTLSVLLLFLAALYPRPVCAWIRQTGVRISGWWARLRRVPAPSTESIASFAANLQGSIELLRRERRRLWLPLLHAFAIPSLQLLMLELLFLAFRSPVGFGMLVAGYAIGTLLVIIAITPAGLGPVEGIMILTYSSLGVEPETAALVTLLYRGVSFWLPLVAGFFALRRLQ
jgi:glycosyltransferase 2 family protein